MCPARPDDGSEGTEFANETAEQLLPSPSQCQASPGMPVGACSLIPAVAHLCTSLAAQPWPVVSPLLQLDTIQATPNPSLGELCVKPALRGPEDGDIVVLCCFVGGMVRSLTPALASSQSTVPSNTCVSSYNDRRMGGSHGHVSDK